MLRIKILDSKNHPFTNKIKVYGISIETILIIAFALVVLFVVAVYFTRPVKKEAIAPKSMQLKTSVTEENKRLNFSNCTT